MNSCSAECLNKVQNSSDDHVLTSTHSEVYKDGHLFLRNLISRCVVDNRWTILYYSHQLTCLDQLMIKLNNDITTFNDEVQNIVYQLQSRDKSIQHLMVNLFKGYEAPPDKKFCVLHPSEESITKKGITTWAGHTRNLLQPEVSVWLIITPTLGTDIEKSSRH